jgi:SAM-dependent methyltransferase
MPEKQHEIVPNRSCLYDGAMGYIGEIYDRVEPEINDVLTLRRLIGDNKLRILEVFCGHGRILLPLATDGHVITGIDLSATFLGILEQRVSKLPEAIGNSITLIRGDAVAGNYPTGFDLVILGGNCLYELGTPEDQEACIRNAAQALRPGGYLWLDCDHQEGELRKSWQRVGEVNANAFPSGICDDGAVVKSISETIWFDAEKRLVQERRRTVVEKDGRVLHEQEFVVQTHPPSTVEMRQWLEDNGFEIISLWGDHTNEIPYTDESGRATFWAIKNA